MLGVQAVAEFGPSVPVGVGYVSLGRSPASDLSRVAVGDRYDENRVGLDHLRFGGASPSRVGVGRAAPGYRRRAARRHHRPRLGFPPLHPGRPRPRQHSA
ncbi:MAG: hypothetical protein AVDCRST_MAG49-3096 [uncultured Thermomicrobiales bacterium]|uniref:Uncharacterized protein n=1 Tax=uncultured Thermomicrobiales bacterium TaxID=1645740 RepID=A0A6J4V4A9_9BACT|nr:MAG: hypothetical protein AVDCRST_MAG49-3096 [uncultured Thermomicrobiales bacterium]